MSTAQRFVAAARQHADTVLAGAADRWGAHHTPLLADGLHLESLEPVTWVQHGRSWILSNPASQQNFLRVLCGLEAAGAGERYGATARGITSYVLRHMRFGDMVWWGSHCTADLLHNKLVFCTDGSPYPRHELKRCFPFYELMHEVDPRETRRVVEGTWDMHVRDWSVLSFNRHNIANLPRGEGGQGQAAARSTWDRAYTGGPFTSEQFTFMPAGMDLAYSAARLHALSGDPAPLQWARRLVARYLEAAHPESGLPAYLYNSSDRAARPAEGIEARGDRAAAQLGSQLGRPVEERFVWTADQERDALYCFVALLELSRSGIDPWFGDQAVCALQAFANHVVDPANGALHPVLNDGTRLTGHVLEHDGYFGAGGTAFASKAAHAPTLLAFAYGWRHAPRDALWQACRVMARELKLGDLGPPGGAQAELNTRAGASDPLTLFAVLALHQATGQDAFLRLAERLGDNMMAKRLRSGLFASPQRQYARIDAIEPLALLHLAQALGAVQDPVPAWPGGSGRFHAHFDGHGRTTDSKLFYG